MTSGPDTRPSARAPVARLALASCIGIVLLSCEDGAAPTAAPPATTPATPPAPPPPAPQPPNAPANLRVTAVGQDFVEWSWNAVPGAIGYVVQVSRDENVRRLGPDPRDGGDHVHRHRSSTGTSVYVRVAAASGTAEAPLVGAWTAQVAGMTAAPLPPASPTGLVVSATTENSITWTWNAVAGATGYEVQFSRDAEFTEADEVIDVSGQTVYRRERLSAETRVYLRVRSYRETEDDRLRSGWTAALPAVTLAPAIPVTIPDPGLRRAVIVALGKRAGDPVTRRDLSTLSRLNARSAQIVDLTGLEWATGLEQLFLSDNRISNLSPLAGLTGLERLDLNFNGINTNLSPLAGLTGLKQLFLKGNNLSDISPLAGLTRLERLHLARNRHLGHLATGGIAQTGAAESAIQQNLEHFATGAANRTEMAIPGRQRHLGHLAAGAADVSGTDTAMPSPSQHLGHLGAGGIDRTAGPVSARQQHLGHLAASGIDRTGGACHLEQQHLGHLAAGGIERIESAVPHEQQRCGPDADSAFALGRGRRPCTPGTILFGKHRSTCS